MQIRNIPGRAVAMLVLTAATLACADEGARTSADPASAGAGQSSVKLEVDPALPAYQKSADKIEGNVTVAGSDTMINLMTLWAEELAKSYGKGIVPQVEGKGSGTAPTALIEGTVLFGSMSRDMKAEEIEKFEKKYGYKPTRLRVALDGIAVFVHRDNPIKTLSLAQVDGAFSSARKRGGKDAATWGDLGLTGEWADKPVTLYGRNSASGTNGFFKEHALKKGDFKNTVKELGGSADVVNAVSSDKYALGYSGVGYASSGVRAVPLSEKDGEAAFEPSQKNVMDGTYPMWRYLNVYINKAPGQPLSPLVREFCRLIFSKEGQEVAVKDRNLPIDAKTAEKERKILD